ncbi:putative transcriptional regulatory protein [Fusarium oxysporum f. sp. albedinis]|nr:putative transcriptional regulatory protein [Fusarium oxysporum f. sp. albedinis]
MVLPLAAHILSRLLSTESPRISPPKLRAMTLRGAAPSISPELSTPPILTLSPNMALTTLPDTVVATGSEKPITYSTDRKPDKVHDPALFKKSDAVLADIISSKSQPSAIVPYQQPGGAARGAEVTAGASRFGVHMAVAVAGIFAPII